jgi:hypothetical protein
VQSLMAGRTTRLDLRADGTFTLTDYPIFYRPSQPESGAVSVTGQWTCSVVDHIDQSQGLVAAGLPMWGIQFRSDDPKLNRAHLFGRKRPYRMRVEWGQSDLERQYVEFKLDQGRSVK